MRPRARFCIRNTIASPVCDATFHSSRASQPRGAVRETTFHRPGCSIGCHRVRDITSLLDEDRAAPRHDDRPGPIAQYVKLRFMNRHLVCETTFHEQTSTVMQGCVRLPLSGRAFATH
jgi:hypothetical protein